MSKVFFQIPRIKQEENECASTSLLQILRYFGDNKTSLDKIINYCGDHLRFREWDYLLGCFALDIGFYVLVHSRSLSIYDSTWFDLKVPQLIEKLKEQEKNTKKLKQKFYGYKKLNLETKCAMSFLEKGGKIDFSSFSKELIRSYLVKEIPVIATFTAQLVYKIPKEIGEEKDDIKGEPWKHTLVINGFDGNKFYVTDPSSFQEKLRYSINSDVLLDAIIRYDSNLLVINKKRFF